MSASEIIPTEVKKATEYKQEGAYIDQNPLYGIPDGRSHIFYMNNTRWSPIENQYSDLDEEYLKKSDEYTITQALITDKFKYVYSQSDELLFQCTVLWLDKVHKNPWYSKEVFDTPIIVRRAISKSGETPVFLDSTPLFLGEPKIKW